MKKNYEILVREKYSLSSVGSSQIWFRRYIKTEILQIWHKTSDQSCSDEEGEGGGIKQEIYSTYKNSEEKMKKTLWNVR